MNEEVQFILDSLKEQMGNAMHHLGIEFSNIRAGKASPSMLKNVSVNYYGASTPLGQVANINTLDAHTITIQPWEKSLLNEIMRAIINANLGFAPQSNGESLLISVPPLTEERRRDLVKMAKAEGENAKVAVRNNRKDAMDMIKSLKEDGLPEDMQKDAEGEVQTITNSFSNKIDDLIKDKETDIMTI